MWLGGQFCPPPCGIGLKSISFWKLNANFWYVKMFRLHPIFRWKTLFLTKIDCISIEDRPKTKNEIALRKIALFTRIHKCVLIISKIFSVCSWILSLLSPTPCLRIGHVHLRCAVLDLFWTFRHRISKNVSLIIFKIFIFSCCTGG